MENHVHTDPIGNHLMGDGDKDHSLLNQKPHIKQKCMFTANLAHSTKVLYIVPLFNKFPE